MTCGNVGHGTEWWPQPLRVVDTVTACTLPKKSPDACGSTQKASCNCVGLSFYITSSLKQHVHYAVAWWRS